MTTDTENPSSDLQEQLEHLKRQNSTLTQQIAELTHNLTTTNSSVSIAGLATLALRIDPDDTIVYVNSPSEFRDCTIGTGTHSSMHSQLYEIDPDGQAYGENPISVYCNLDQGKH